MLVRLRQIANVTIYVNLSIIVSSVVLPLRGLDLDGVEETIQHSKGGEFAHNKVEVAAGGLRGVAHDNRRW